MVDPDPRQVWSPWRSFVKDPNPGDSEAGEVTVYAGPPSPTDTSAHPWIHLFEWTITAPTVTTPTVFPLVFRPYQGGIVQGIDYFGEPSPPRKVLVVPSGSLPTTLPNIVNIVADDLDFCDLRNFHDPDDTPVQDASHAIETDRIDGGLIDQGMSFTQYRANGSICSPTRAALMTGRSPVGMGIKRDIAGRGVAADIPMLSEWLKARGYSTGQFGKWHVGFTREQFRPTSRAFDESLALLTGSANYWCYQLLADDQRTETHDLTTNTQYLDGRIADAAVDFIDAHRNDDEPFFMNVWFYSPHTPNNRYGDPAAPDCPEPNHMGGTANSYQIYERQVEFLDDMVGRVLDALADPVAGDISDETIVVFSSDNGGTNLSRSNSPCAGEALRGIKGDSWDGGIRVPLIVRWPDGGVPVGTNESWAFSYDLFPTIAEIVDGALGLSIPQPVVDFEPAAMSLEPALLDAALSLKRDERHYWEQKDGKAYFTPANGDERNNYAVLESGARSTAPLKLVQEAPFASLRLFDLEQHPDEPESGDSAGAMPATVASLEDAYLQYRVATSRIGLDLDQATTEGAASIVSASSGDGYDVDLPKDASGNATARVVLAPDTRFDIHRGDFTFEANVTLDELPPGADPVIARQAGAWTLSVERSTRRVHLEVTAMNGGTQVISSTNALALGGPPSDVAFTIYGFNATGCKRPVHTIVTLAVDGEVIANECLSGPIALSDAPVVLGNNEEPPGSQLGRAFVGELTNLSMHQVALYKEQLDAAQIGGVVQSTSIACFPACTCSDPSDC